MMNLSFKLTYNVVFRHLAPPFVELISQGESPASVVSTSVHEYVSMSINIFLFLLHLLQQRHIGVQVSVRSSVHLSVHLRQP